MTPINEFVVKIASRCNLNCDYCYEYNGGDTSWRQMPSTMSYELATALAARIREHAETYALSHVHIGLHGGEPLVVPLQRLERLVRLFRSLEAPSRSIGISLQTNATLLRREHAELFRETDVEVSVSIDGDRSANDRHRHDHSGRSSFLALLAGIRTMQQFAPNNLVGLLAVVDVANNPSDTLDFLGSFEVSQVDFLLPHYHWDRLPPRPPRPMDGDVAYGRWMLDVYRAWAGGAADTSPHPVSRACDSTPRGCTRALRADVDRTRNARRSEYRGKLRSRRLAQEHRVWCTAFASVSAARHIGRGCDAPHDCDPPIRRRSTEPGLQSMPTRRHLCWRILSAPVRTTTWVRQSECILCRPALVL